MSPEVLKKLSYALGVLVVLWVGSEILKGEPSDGVTVMESPGVTIDEVDSITIDRPDDDVHLVRHDSTWTVNGLDAGFGGVSDFVGALDEDLRLQLAARNPDSHERFDLTDGTARHLRVYRGSVLVLDLLVGKRGRDYQSVFLRRPGEDEVYSSRTRLGSFVERRIEDWRDKVIAAVVPDSVLRVAVTKGAETYTVARDDKDVWYLDGDVANGASVNRLLEQFRALNAAGFPTEAQADSADFEHPERRVEIVDRSDQVVADIAFDSTATGFWVRKSGLETVFRLDRYKVDQLTPADSTLREGNAS